MRARLTILNAVILAVGVVAWRLGLLDGFASIGVREYELCGVLVALFLVGQAAAWLGRWDAVMKIAQLLPMLALFATVAGVLHAKTLGQSDNWALFATVAGVLHAKTLGQSDNWALFDAIVSALGPNAVGIGAMFWLRVLAFWAPTDES